MAKYGEPFYNFEHNIKRKKFYKYNEISHLLFLQPSLKSSV